MKIDLERVIFLTETETSTKLYTYDKHKTHNPWKLTPTNVNDFTVHVYDTTRAKRQDRKHKYFNCDFMHVLESSTKAEGKEN